MELQKEYENLQNKVKRRAMGNTKFVGELYKIGMLSINIMNNCIRQFVISNNETELEALSKLIPAIGRRMEGEEKGRDVSTTYIYFYVRLTPGGRVDFEKNVRPSTMVHVDNLQKN